ncbi:MAG: proliferating cell nuclear antigen (pcna) [Candidatus Nanoarchaeia archaeon]
MKLVLAEPRLLKESVSIISDLVNEVTFKADSDKIELTAMDPANVAMVMFKILSSAFVDYKVEKPVSFSVNLDNLDQILKRAKPTDTINMELDSKNNKLKVQIKGESNKTFNLSLIDIDESEQKVPDLKFNVKAEVPSQIFSESVEDMDIVAESVAIVAEANKLSISSEGRFNAAKVEIPGGGDSAVISVGKKDKVVSKYSIEYLKKIVKGSKLADVAVIQFSDEYPLRVDYKVMDKLLLSFILAPRVDSD